MPVLLFYQIFLIWQIAIREIKLIHLLFQVPLYSCIILNGSLNPITLVQPQHMHY